ncbi:MAG: DNA-binding response regulator, partial [Phycisphaerae bacterium]|nr:DNA-binding response regulator [Phycisphaerae bacterium]
MPGELEGKTILLVDDDRDIMTAMTAALQDMGPQVFTAMNG